MEPSILKSVKKNLGLDPDYTVFDLDIVMFINTAFGTLQQLGVGPVEGFGIEDESAEWDDFVIDNEELAQRNTVKIYVVLRARLLFDPPVTSYLITAFEKQISELEWRLNVRREGTEWADPDPMVVIDE